MIIMIILLLLLLLLYVKKWCLDAIGERYLQSNNEGCWGQLLGCLPFAALSNIHWRNKGWPFWGNSNQSKKPMKYSAALWHRAARRWNYFAYFLQPLYRTFFLFTGAFVIIIPTFINLHFFSFFSFLFFSFLISFFVVSFLYIYFQPRFLSRTKERLLFSMIFGSNYPV